jgi:hypothetical protein
MSGYKHLAINVWQSAKKKTLLESEIDEREKPGEEDGSGGQR